MFTSMEDPIWQQPLQEEEVEEVVVVVVVVELEFTEIDESNMGRQREV